MTENAFTMYDAWYEANKNIIFRYNQMLVIRDNPQWEILEFLYGFGYHEFESCVLEMRAKRNILSAKQDSKTSHTNQAYNQLVANNDKNKEAENLACQRNMKNVNKGVVDQ